jgi:hypothetical protein
VTGVPEKDRDTTGQGRATGPTRNEPPWQVWFTRSFFVRPLRSFPTARRLVYVPQPPASGQNSRQAGGLVGGGQASPQREMGESPERAAQRPAARNTGRYAAVLVLEAEGFL